MEVLITTRANDQAGLGLIGATSLAVTIVIGSGALILPGIAYQEAGSAAVWAWVSAAVLIVPLLVVLGQLGRTLPGAAGVAGYVQAAFGRRAAAGTEILLMGTFCFGIPGIALAGGHYLATTIGLTSAFGAAGALLMVIVAVLLNCVGARLSGIVQSILCAVLVTGLAVIALCGLLLGTAGQPWPSTSSVALVTGITHIGTVFFAFTGWELISFTTGEYARPKRDFPYVLAISYLIVIAIYIALALAVQSTLSVDAQDIELRPMELMMTTLFGPAAATVVAATGAVLLLASVLGNMWGASRLVMSSASERLLPAGLALRNRYGVPHRAIISCGLAFAVVIATNSVGWLSIAAILSLAGKNFLLLYFICCLAHFRLFQGLGGRIAATASVVLLVVPLVTFGWRSLTYAGALLVLGMSLTPRAPTPTGERAGTPSQPVNAGDVNAGPMS